MKATLRLLLALVAVAVCIPSAPATAAPVSLQTQTFSGGSGSGGESHFPQSANPVQAAGYYSTKSQLAVGNWAFNESSGAPKFAQFTRWDGMKLQGTNRLTPNACGAMPPNTTCLTLELDGNADIAHAHLVIAKQVVAKDEGGHLRVAFLMSGTLTLNRRTGYAIVAANGRVFTTDGIEHLGDAPTTGVTDIELTPSRQGYWIVNRVGQVFAFGNARYLGNANRSAFAAGEFVSAIVSSPTGKGYWLFTTRGRVVPFGDAKFLGDLHTTPINGRIVGAVATPTGKGYFLAASDGGVFAYGDARFRGSMSGVRLNRPVVAISLTPNGTGYWLFGGDGGVFSFNAAYVGALGVFVEPGEAVTAAGPGGAAYRQALNDGEVFIRALGQVLDFVGPRHLTTPIVGIASTV